MPIPSEEYTTCYALTLSFILKSLNVQTIIHRKKNGAITTQLSVNSISNNNHDTVSSIPILDFHHYRILYIHRVRNPIIHPRQDQRKIPPETAVNAPGSSSQCYASYSSLQRRKDRQSKNG